MKTLIVIALSLICSLPLNAQTKSTNAAGTTTKATNSSLPALQDAILLTQANVGLYTRNLGNNSLERDVNSIIKDIELYIDSLRGGTRGDALLVKNFAAMRSFYLTTTNKTTVATSFLYADVPYTYAMHKGEVALHIGAIENGEVYDLSKQTEQKVLQAALSRCLLPSLDAFGEFRDTDIRYVALSIYYGTKDSREGAVESVAPHCLTLVSTLADVQQYIDGMITAKGLLSRSELLLSGAADYAALTTLRILPDGGADFVDVSSVPDMNTLLEVK